MNDHILRATAGNDTFRVFVAVTKDTVNEAHRLHDTSPVVSAALGRLLTAASIMGATLKNDSDIVTLSINSDGPVKGLLVTSDSLSRVKGYAFENNIDLPLNSKGKLDVSSAIGEGTMSIVKDMGLKSPYVGQIPLVSGEIAEDLTYYFAKSEQIPSSVSLGVLVDVDCSIKQAGGFLIQVLPEAEEDYVDILERNIRSLPSFTDLLEKGMSSEDILALITEGLGYSITDTIPVSYYCNCSKERVEKALISIGLKELSEIMTEDKHATLHCHFCNKDYDFTEDDLRMIINNL